MNLLRKFEHLISVEVQIKDSNETSLHVQTDCRASAASAQFGPISITAAISRFHLNFILSGATAPIEYWKYDSPDIKNKKIKANKKTKFTKSLGSKLNGKITISSAAGNAAVDSKNIESETISLDFSTTDQTIRARGTKERPSWTLSASVGSKIIEGTILKGDHLFKIQPHSDKLKIETEIEIPEDAIMFPTGNGNFDSRANKVNIIKILTKKLLRGKHKFNIIERNISDENR